MAATLDVIAFAEGKTDYGTIVRGKVIKAPYNPELVGQSNVTISDFSRHPEILVQVNNRGLNSTAAGRYQILAGTWQALVMPDFSPSSQDLAAMTLMSRRGMIKPLLAGNFEEAVRKGNKEWASLPGSPYGQGTKRMSELKAVYEQAFNDCQDRMQ